MSTTATMSAPATCHTYVSLSNFDWSFSRSGPLPWSPGVYSLIAVFTALACWSTVTLTVRILFFFKRYTGLYFWSLIITSWMLSIREVGFLMRWVAPQIPWEFSLFLAEFGWVLMVLGYNLVLWSRLSIITESRRLINLSLAVIIVNGVIFHTALIVLQFGLAHAGANGLDRNVWLRLVNPWERVQITFFTFQECGLSAIYMVGVYRLLQDRVHRTKETKNVLMLLFAVQTIVILLDIVVCTLDLAGYFTLKAIIHSWVYGVKLELEFVVLNQLVDIAKTGVPGLSTISDDSVPVTSTATGTTGSSTTAMPSPDSQSSLSSQNLDWWGVPPSGSPARRMSSPVPSGQELKSIPEVNHSRSQTMSIEEMLEGPARPRQLSLERIGIIPDP